MRRAGVPATPFPGGGAVVATDGLAYRRLMDAVRLRAGWLLRHNVVATVAFALVAGLVGGLAISAWTSARRSADALASFLEAADLPTLSLIFCRPGVVNPTPEDLRELCFTYDAADELAEVRGLPTVRQAVRVAGRLAVMTGPVEVGDEPVFVNMMRDPGLETVSGRPVVLAGRLADDDADDEAIINELFRDRYGVEVGDRVQLQFLTEADLETSGADPATPRPTVEVEVVGLVRTEDDLNAGVSFETREMIQTPPGVERRAAGAATIYSAIMIRTTDDVAARASIDDAFRGRTFNNSFNVAADDFVPIDDAYRYESRAAVAFAVVTALAGLVFVGQALSRQVRKEWSDLPALRALGMSSRQVAASCTARAAPIALGAAAVAALVAVALSPFLPVGSARAAVLDRGAQLDGVVLAIALPLLVGLVMVVAWFPVWRSERSRAGRPRERRAPVGTGWSPPASVGVGLALNGSAPRHRAARRRGRGGRGPRRSWRWSRVSGWSRASTASSTHPGCTARPGISRRRAPWSTRCLTRSRPRSWRSTGWSVPVGCSAPTSCSTTSPPG